MSFNKKIQFICLLQICLSLTLTGFSQNEDRVRVLFYNVENLFDTKDDSITDDEEFLPNGPRGWNYEKYRDKVNSLSKVILPAGEWIPPDIFGLCEVENSEVVGDLLNKTALSGFNYSMVHKDSPDPRGIDVCLVYNEDRVELLEYDYFMPYVWKKENYRSREVLHAVLGVYGDTLHLFVGHWPSRRGGVLATRNRRIELSDFINYKIDSLAHVYGDDIKVVVMGDFNSAPEDEEMTNFLGGTGRVKLKNLSASWPIGAGSYKYQGKWEYFDQIIVSENMLESRNGLGTVVEASSVFILESLLTDDVNYTGKRPFSSWWGYSYQGGYSDHLPVFMDLITTVH